MLEQLGLTTVAQKKPKTFSIGMGQRLGLAAALLGDPHTLILDEPANGLDPQGIQWIRELLKDFAATGRSVFVSSHLLSEMALMADQLVVIGRGKLIASGPIEDFVKTSSRNAVLVRSPQATELAELLRREGARRRARSGPGSLTIVGMDAAAVGDLAFDNGDPDPRAGPPRRDAGGGVPRGDRGRAGVRSARGAAGHPPGAATSRPAGRGGYGVIAALKYEWVRIRTIRSTWWLSAVVLVFGMGLSFLTAMGMSLLVRQPDAPTQEDLEIIGPGIVTQFANFGVPYFVGYIIAMLGVLAWGHEYRHGMIRATLTALSSRTAHGPRSTSWSARGWRRSPLLTLLGSVLVGWLWLAGNGVRVCDRPTSAVVGRRSATP